MLSLPSGDQNLGTNYEVLRVDEFSAGLHRSGVPQRASLESLVVASGPPEAGNPLDGCLHVFLDLGSNRGLQIRKLYEPHLFPLAPVLPLYER